MVWSKCAPNRKQDTEAPARPVDLLGDTGDNLTRPNPRQPDLPFRDVNAAAGAPRTVS